MSDQVPDADLPPDSSVFAYATPPADLTSVVIVAREMQNREIVRLCKLVGKTFVELLRGHLPGSHRPPKSLAPVA